MDGGEGSVNTVGTTTDYGKDLMLIWIFDPRIDLKFQDISGVNWQSAAIMGRSIHGDEGL